MFAATTGSATPGTDLHMAHKAVTVVGALLIGNLVWKAAWRLLDRL